ncbi:uncharacterized protein LOC125502610 isoform X1 [Dendroctonus ponderosae]|uniref:uncharacterized protein LOC125502610 isoform X1 n=1 Tax=Dendroctonus ponderosae TaxID=77166 RepID=UPI002034F422|nr:uncharacterized protein LOC125502610 isoform X1 [Dendroctonus ponderosae]KAH1023264.1 hypothetical protein HUJ04_012501 [Dendroctonus ponderosae]KAH1029731.1 hypothetical protein HUJ05_002909 [Dendroctonus ponderosae]
MEDKQPSGKSFRFVAPLMKFCTIFGMCPPVFPRNSDQPLSFLWYKMYSCFIGISSVAVTIFVMYKKENTSGPIASVHAANTFAHCALTLTCLVMLVSLVYGKSKGSALKKMFEAMDDIDEKLKFDSFSIRKQMYIGVTIYIVLIVVYVVYDAVTWTLLLGISWYILYMPKTIQICQFSLGMLLPMALLSLIYLRIKGFNKALRHYSKVNFSQISCYSLNEQRQFFFKEMCHMHTDLFQMVKSFNRIFGIVLLFGTLMAIGLILHYIVILLVYFEFNTELKGQSNHYVLAQCITGILIPALQVLALANVGDRVSFEAGKTSNITMVLLNKFPSHGTTEVEKAIYVELKTLVMQCSFRNIQITAKRFFSVNHTLLGVLLSSMVSYIIIIVQFLSMNNEQ